MALAVCCAAMVAWSAAAGGQSRTAPPGAPGSCMARGRALFAQECASCHGEDLRGRPEKGPSLRGAGAAAADFYLSTGRMPLADPTDEPTRAHPPTRAPTSRARRLRRLVRRPRDPARRSRARSAGHGHGEVHRELRRLPPDHRARRDRHRRRRPGPQRHHADPDRRGRPRRALPDAELRRAPDRPARRSTRSRATCVDPPPARPRRLGHRQHRPGPRGDGDVAAGRRCCSASRG